MNDLRGVHSGLPRLSVEMYFGSRYRKNPRTIRDVYCGCPNARDGGTAHGDWTISCSVTTHAEGGWTGSRHTPTFYLHEDVQGIVSEEHAVRIARDVVDPLGLLADGDVHLIAVKI